LELQEIATPVLNEFTNCFHPLSGAEGMSELVRRSSTNFGMTQRKSSSSIGVPPDQSRSPDPGEITRDARYQNTISSGDHFVF